MSKQVRSATVIAQLLGTEGFSDFTANQVEKYWRTRSGLTDRQQRQIDRLNKEVSLIMSGLSEGDCLVIGKFIGLHKKMSFDAGLKIGLQAFAQKCDKEILAPQEAPKNGKAKSVSSTAPTQDAQQS